MRHPSLTSPGDDPISGRPWVGRRTLAGVESGARVVQKSPGQGFARRTLLVVALFGLYLALALLGSHLGVFGALSVWFPPAGLALALGYLFGWRALPLVAAAEFTSGIVVFGVHDAFTVPQMVVNAIGYATVYVVPAALVRASGLRARITGLRDGMVLVGVGLVVAPGLGAAFGIAMQMWAGMVAGDEYLSSVAIWWVGDAIGVATVVPAALLVAMVLGLQEPPAVPTSLLRKPTWLTVLTLLAPAVLTAVAFPLGGTLIGVLFLPFLPIAVVAIRHGVAGMVVATVAFSPAVTWFANQYVEVEGLTRTDVQVLLLGLVVTGYVIALAIDERDTGRHRLARREAHLAQAQTLAGMGSLRHDVARNRAEWSDGLFALHGLAPTATGMSLQDHIDHIHPDDRDRITADLASLTERPTSIRDEYRIVRPDGTTRWVESRMESIPDARGAVRSILGTLQDVSSVHAAHEALRAAVERERLAADRITEADRYKDGLLTAVSHEVRTPLTVLLGVTETLSRPDVLGDAALVNQLVTRLAANAQRLDALLEDLLAAERAIDGDLEAQRRPTRLSSVASAVVDRLDLDGRPVHIEVTTDEVHVDPDLVARILDHLLTNARRYTEPTCDVWIRTEVEHGDLVLVVEDAGPGVPPSDADDVFRLFHHGRTIEHSPGTGIGLFLVARFAEAHGGTARVEPRPGGGASFRILLADALAHTSEPADA